MGTRRQAREAALQMLYLSDNCSFSPEETLYYLKTLDLTDGTLQFAEHLFIGTCEKKEQLDRLISEHAQNWEMDRMAAVDRNILRLSAYELLDMPETPVNVIIDEAVEIAKTFSTSDSSKFVNGILDKLKNIRNSRPGQPHP